MNNDKWKYNEDSEYESKEASRAQMGIYDWIQCFVTALVCGVLIFIFIGRTIAVEGSSMATTLRNSDRVVMHNIFYTPKNGDIVVFKSSAARFNDIPLVKRVIAVANQTIDIDFEKGDVYIDGVVIFEPYIHNLTTNRQDFTGPITIPEGYIFVMGDNRNGSTDSRNNDVGLVDTRYVLGKVIFLLIPGENLGEPRDWSRIGVVR